MFAIIATKPLSDGTNGFRFNVLGKKGLVRVRKHKHNGWFTRCGSYAMPGLNMGRMSVYVECKPNQKDIARKLRHFAG